VDRYARRVSPGPPDPIDHHHRNLSGGGPRAAVFGVSDGLVTNVSLILGVAGGHPSAGIVRLAGLAGLVAGAFSMAGGEYVSMQAQRELMQRELDVERRSLAHSPEGEARELVSIYESRGIDPSVARDVVDEVMKDPELALETHAREELGINPGQLGMPIQAALASFFSFAIGAVLPLVPWLIGSGTGAIIGSVVVSATAALVVGAVLGGLSGRSRLRGAARQLAVAVVAAGITFGIGRAVGTSVH
jgi:VIT1/CCC1 family predicted Fe2+/Mn2+ transporter